MLETSHLLAVASELRKKGRKNRVIIAGATDGEAEPGEGPGAPQLLASSLQRHL